jgi:hypothetical protein
MYQTRSHRMPPPAQVVAVVLNVPDHQRQQPIGQSPQPTSAPKSSPSGKVVLEKSARAFQPTVQKRTSRKRRSPFPFTTKEFLKEQISTGPSAVCALVGPRDDRNAKHASCTLGYAPTAGIYLCSKCGKTVSSYDCATCGKSFEDHFKVSGGTGPRHIFQSSRRFNPNSRNHTCCHPACVASSFEVVQVLQKLCPCLPMLVRDAEDICKTYEGVVPTRAVTASQLFLALPDGSELDAFVRDGVTGDTIATFIQDIAHVLSMLPATVKEMQPPPLKRDTRSNLHKTKRNRRTPNVVGEECRTLAFSRAFVHFIRIFVSGTSKSQSLNSAAYFISNIYPCFTPRGVLDILSRTFRDYVRRFVDDQGMLSLVGQTTFPLREHNYRLLHSLMSIVLPITQKIDRSMRAANWRMGGEEPVFFIVSQCYLGTGGKPASARPACMSPAPTIMLVAGGGATTTESGSVWHSLSTTPMVVRTGANALLQMSAFTTPHITPAPSITGSPMRLLTAQSPFGRGGGDEDGDGDEDDEDEESVRMMPFLATPGNRQPIMPGDWSVSSTNIIPSSVLSSSSAGPGADAGPGAAAPPLNMLQPSAFNTPVVYQTPLSDPTLCTCHIQKPNQRCMFCVHVGHSEEFLATCRANRRQMVFPVCPPGTRDPVCFLTNSVVLHCAENGGGVDGPAPTRTARRSREMATRHLEMLANRLTHHNTIRLDTERLFRSFLGKY